VTALDWLARRMLDLILGAGQAAAPREPASARPRDAYFAAFMARCMRQVYGIPGADLPQRRR
jgi:hypothetical protein